MQFCGILQLEQQNSKRCTGQDNMYEIEFPWSIHHVVQHTVSACITCLLEKMVRAKLRNLSFLTMWVTEVVLYKASAGYSQHIV